MSSASNPGNGFPADWLRPGPGRLAVALMALALAACGGGSGGSDGGVGGGSDGDAGSGFSFQSASSGAGDQPREVRLSWRVTEEPDRYRIEVNPDGSSGFRAVDVNGDGVVDADDLIDGSAGRVDIPLSLHKTAFDDALYRIVALDADGEELGSADGISLMAVSAEELIGYFKASNTDSGDEFGDGVALSGDGETLAVGAPEESSAATGIDGNEVNNLESGAGATYVFVRDDQDTWSQQAYIKASNTDDGDLFGGAVALSDDGDTLAVGAQEEDGAATGIGGEQTDNGEDAGAAYVFTRDRQGAWSQQAYVKASNTGSQDEFGDSVALSDDGETLAVGAPGEDSAARGVDGDEADNEARDAGAVYVYTRDEQEGWTQPVYVKASNTGAGDAFGSSVALDDGGDTLAVGAEEEDSAATGVGADQSDDSADRAGAVYVFTRGGQGEWSQQAYVKASNTDPGDAFGAGVAIAGDGNTLAVGAPLEDSAARGVDGDGDETDNEALEAGAVYVYTRKDQGSWAQQAYVKASNGDGGVERELPDEEPCFMGPCPPREPPPPRTPEERGDTFGRSVALSDDGDTLAVGAPFESSAATGIGGDQVDESAGAAGALYVFTRNGRERWSQQAYIKASNTDALDRFGRTVALGAGGAMLAAGARAEAGLALGIDGDETNNGGEDAGAVYLY